MSQGNLHDKLDEIESKLDKLEEKVDSNNIRGFQNEQQISFPQNKFVDFRTFIRLSDKYYVYNGDENQYKKEKKLVLIFLAVYLALCVVSTIITTYASSFYTTFTLFENIWGIISIVLLVYVLKSKYKYNMDKYYMNSYEKFVLDDFLVFENTHKKKFMYRFFSVLNVIATIANIIFLFLDESLGVAICASIFEVASLVLFFISWIKVQDLFWSYSIGYFEGMYNDKETKLLFSFLDQKWYTLEEYNNKYHRNILK